MSIGEALAQARHQAGLTVAEVSHRTRIRETVIRGIEGGDYSACGGDFYTRGYIRIIAKEVGADPEPLIREYDAVHRGPGALSAVSLDELLTSARTSAGGRRCARSLLSRSASSAASTARPAQSSRGRALVRRSTAISCRSTSRSAFAGAGERPGRTSQPQTRTKIR